MCFECDKRTSITLLQREEDASRREASRCRPQLSSGVEVPGTGGRGAQVHASRSCGGVCAQVLPRILQVYPAHPPSKQGTDKLPTALAPSPRSDFGTTRAALCSGSEELSDGTERETLVTRSHIGFAVRELIRCRAGTFCHRDGGDRPLPLLDGQRALARHCYGEAASHDPPARLGRAERSGIGLGPCHDRVPLPG
jgi:hypothetical protein